MTRAHNVLPVPDLPQTGKPTLAVDPQGWTALMRRAGLTTEGAQARALGVSRQHLNLVRNGHRAPGPEFLARVWQRFPDADPRALFPVVTKG